MTNLIDKISNQPFDNWFHREDFDSFVSAYLNDKDGDKQSFEERLGLYLNISTEQCNKILSGPINLKGILELQSAAKNLISSYKERITNKSARLASLELSHNEWIKIIHTLQDQKLTRIHTAAFIDAVARTKNIDHSVITETLKSDPSSRSGPRKRRISELAKPANDYERGPKRSRDPGVPAVVPDNLTPNSKALAQKSGGVEVSLQPTPNKTACFSPGQTKYRRFADIRNISMFTKLTPTRQMPPTIDKAERVMSQTFTATLATMSMHAIGRRPRTQKSLMGGKSAKEIFETEGICTEGKTNWSHLITYYLGGAHGPENLAPTTAEANQNMLRAYELRVGKILREKLTNEVKIEAKSYFEKKEDEVPFQIEIMLSWLVKGEQHQETHYINPRSTSKLSNSHIKTIEGLTPLSPRTLSF